METVLLLRRNPEDLSELETSALKAQFGPDVNFVRTDPTDYKEHLEDCQNIRPAAVLLPKEKPIPSDAMEAGFPHIVVFPDGKLAQLEPLIPSFKSL
jgi:hypothetical protein